MNLAFARMPIQRRLILVALFVTVPAVLLATAGLTAVDLWRYWDTGSTDIQSLASVVAENAAAAVAFNNKDDADRTLSAMRVRPAVLRACLFLTDGRLFTGWARQPEFRCPAERPAAGWLGGTRLAGTADIVQRGSTFGSVYIERELPNVLSRIAATALISAIVLGVVGALAVILAHRLLRSVSEPITQLAEAARAIGPDTANPALPTSETTIEEVGDLSRALSGMLQRVSDANEQLRRREAEREELLVREREASRLKDEFLAAVSHELRTPLNAIVGWVQILSRTDVDNENYKKGIASIARNARAQTRVIEDLLDVSRIVTGKLTLRFDPVDLRDTISSAIDVIRPAAQSKGIHLDVISPPAACLVNGDHDRLQQVIWNLLSNAVKFTDAGGQVSIALGGQRGAYEIAVRDTGAGIRPAFLPFVFDPFRQADGSLTREHGGLGLGLAIVKQITELHGGSVHVTSDGLGQGTTFRVRLPALAGLMDAGPAVHEAPAAISPDALKGVSVLVVDDNKDAMDVMAMALLSSGADTRTARTGAQALAEWEARPADVLLCDLAMPGMDGFEVLRRIRERDTAARRPTRAIAVSAHVSEEHAARSRRAGFAGHVTKPFQVSDLVRTISEILAAPL